MKVVRIVQNRAPSELSYMLSDSQNVGDFINEWIIQNPDRFISGGSMPLIDQRYGFDKTIPVEYP